MASTADALTLAFDHHRAGRLAEAEALYRQILTVDPRCADALHLLGVLAHATGHPEAAVDLIGRAIVIDGAVAVYHSNLGLAFDAAGRPDAAVECFARALALDPTMDKSRRNLRRTRLALCDAYWSENRLADAMAMCEAMLEQDPDDVEALRRMGVFLVRLDRNAEAAAAFRRILAIASDAEVWFNLAKVEFFQSHRDAARDAFLQAFAASGDQVMLVNRGLVLPIIPRSTAEIAAARADFAEAIDWARRSGVTVTDPARDLFAVWFYLAYHGVNDRPLLEGLGAWLRQACPALSWTAPHCLPDAPREPGPLRIGFVSEFFRRHTVGMLNRGLIRALSRAGVHVTVVHTPAPDDEIRRDILASCDESLELPSTIGLEGMRHLIAERRFDVLFYPDLGMGPSTYHLAFARLAPVQCVTMGHPDTTGLATIDWFLSYDAMEPEGADGHYSEMLVRLPGPFACVPRPPYGPSARSLADFGLGGDIHVYVCPQTLHKLHPDFDTVVIDLLRRDPIGRLVLIRDPHPERNALLRERLAAAGPDVIERVVMLGRLAVEDLLRLMDLSHAVLDPFHFSGGHTSLEAFSVGAPIVTLPGEFMRGRVTHGFYQVMGIMDCVATDAADYVRLALRLAHDPTWRAEMKVRILAANGVLFDSAEPLPVLEAFFHRAVIATRPQDEALHIAFITHLAARGRTEEALDQCRTALAVFPDSPKLLHHQALILTQANRDGEAVEAFEKSLAAAADPWVCFNLAKAHLTNSRRDAAREVFQRGHGIDGDPVMSLNRAIVQPIIPADRAEIATARADFQQGVATAEAEGLVIADPAWQLYGTNFYLAYHARDNLPLHRAFAGMLRRACPAVCAAPSPSGRRRSDQRIRVGIVSTYLCQHTIGSIHRGLIETLSRDSFHVTVILRRKSDDVIQQGIVAAADSVAFLPVDDDIPAAQRTIADQDLDVLVYADIGMAPLTTALAHARLAPVQCASLGHPDTTGIPTIDWFLSYDAMEPDDAERHYSEKLIRLPGPFPCYHRPPIAPSSRSLADFGIPGDRNAYLCPQNLFKFHPDFDDVLAEILLGDPRGILVLVANVKPAINEALLRRLRPLVPDLDARVVLVSRLTVSDFIRLMELCPVMLDPLHFSGGNTSMEAFSVGTPIVTLPGEFMRGRVTHGFYKVMGVMDCVATDAADYVRIALRLTHDTAWRAEIRARILAANGALFDNLEPVRALEVFFHQAVVGVRPDDLAARIGLCDALYSRGRTAEALEQCEAALALSPDHPVALHRRGVLRAGLGRREEAVADFERCLVKAPSVAVCFGLGNLHYQSGRRDAAREAFRRAHDIGGDAAMRLNGAILQSIIPKSREDIDASRAAFMAGVNEAEANGLVIANPRWQLYAPNFYLAYQARDNLPLHKAFAGMLRRACPLLSIEAPHCRRPRGEGPIRIGIVSEFLHGHTIGMINRGLIETLSRTRFHVTVILRQKPDDPFQQEIIAAADAVAHLPLVDDVAAAQATVAELALDVLFYTDIGMGMLTYALAFARLAPVQCVSLGHPDTTGISTLDWFVSYDAMEPETAERHYTEKLVRLPGPFACYRWPSIPPSDKSLSDYGLPEDRPLYLCPQSLFKVHPDFDDVLAEILRRDPEGLLVLIADGVQANNDALLTRLRPLMSDLEARVRLVPRMPAADLLRLMALCPVMLDPLHFSGGNTSMEAFSVGTPIVTLPGEFMRGRVTHGFYKVMGIMDCVATDAEDYVRLALRLAHDPAWRAEMTARILAANGVLFDNMEPVRALEAFLERACAQPGSVGNSPPL
ncbi:MAG: tetratricopeptide repeat protein [Alphaproteobacteria bacterium]